ncbi:S-adenosyl-L-methionine-dependent methyltransferase [Phascolomyces articulosus]|uniref:S-adenosyl-L-methionine-dependent methyltransferase n=1 Tax=Phascolomyces articulosus TaxID=60185 RepID=A0AAD5PEL1_9FUNG|nr:S-adenosyl-L-methionine-dependent methyltransferase [Phascolomyces articulosus]
MTSQSKSFNDVDNSISQQLNSNADKKDPSDNNSQQKNVKYLLKNDESEFVRLNSQHEALKLVWKSLYKAPIHDELEKGIKVLDSGCGTGCWILDMCKQYPNSIFLGTDVSTIYSVHDEIKPSNCSFDVANVLEPLPFPDNHFDFIHQRLLVAAIPQDSWQPVVNSFMRILKPGGWVEFMETTDVINLSPKGARLRNLLSSGAAKRGIRSSAPRELELYMLNAGFVNIKAIPMLLPFGKSDMGDNTISSLFQDDFLRLYRREAIQAVAMKYLPEIETPEDYEKFLKDVLAEYDEYNTSLLSFRFYGQKPQ